MEHFKVALFTTLVVVVVADEDCVDARSYSGQLNITSSGHTCQPWSQSHYRGHDELFPVDGSVTNASNYCRDPDKTNELWCYTMDLLTVWEHCNLTICEVHEDEKLVTCVRNGRSTFETCADDTYLYLCYYNSTYFIVTRNYTCEAYTSYCCARGVHGNTSLSNRASLSSKDNQTSPSVIINEEYIKKHSILPFATHSSGADSACPHGYVLHPPLGIIVLLARLL